MTKLGAVLTNGKMTLRPIEESDLTLILAWRNRDSIRTSFFDSAIITWQQHLKFWQNYLCRNNDQMWIVSWKGLPCGTVALYNIDYIDSSAEYGRLMLPDRDAMSDDHQMLKALGGAAHIVNEMIVDYAFTSLGLHKVYGRILAGNQSAIRNVKNSGFTVSKEPDGTLYVERTR